MSEPDWKFYLQRTVDAWVVGGEVVRLGAFEALLPHIDAAYQRGLMAGRSQAGYRKRKEKPCVPSAETPTPASSTGDEP